MDGTPMLNPLVSVATDTTIAYAEQVMDEGLGKKQHDLNKLIFAAMVL